MKLSRLRQEARFGRLVEKGNTPKEEPKVVHARAFLFQASKEEMEYFDYYHLKFGQRIRSGMRDVELKVVDGFANLYEPIEFEGVDGVVNGWALLDTTGRIIFWGMIDSSAVVLDGTKFRLTVGGLEPS